MNRKRAPRRIGAVSATRVPTLEAKTIYATDRSSARPLSSKLALRVFDNRALIRVGAVEQLPHGTLRCQLVGDRLVVSVEKGRRRVGRQLSLAPSSNVLLVEGAFVPESAFSVEVDEFIGTPWHELEYTSVWTVHGLRLNGRMELSVDR